jgi:hypothetical protein
MRHPLSARTRTWVSRNRPSEGRPLWGGIFEPPQCDTVDRRASLGAGYGISPSCLARATAWVRLAAPSFS